MALTGAEDVSVRLAGVAKTPLFLTSIYGAPSSEADKFLTDINLFLATLSMRHSNHITTEDLNINTLKSDLSDNLDLITQYSFTNLISISTQVTKFTETCIDHILINFISLNMLSGTIIKNTSDHFPILITFEQTKQHTLLPRYRICFTDYGPSRQHEPLSKID